MVRNRQRSTRIKRNRRRKPSAFLSGAITVFKVSAGLFLLIVLSNLYVLAHDHFVKSTFFAGKTVRVEGARRLLDKEIVDRAAVKKGANILSVNLTLARKRLEAHPWISHASVRREFPDTVIIEVTEHQGVAMVELHQRYLMNTHGDLFKPYAPQDRLDLPVIQGLTVSDISFSGTYPRITDGEVLKVLHLGSRAGSVLPNTMVRRILVDREVGTTLCVSDEEKTIQLGHSDYPAKYKNLKRVLSFIEKFDHAVDFYRVDLTEVEKIVVDPVLNPQAPAEHKEA